ncbi:MAG: hypothetical protein KatS3mg118_2148 [Paracoccaceae bacterium]|nr:MAG: cell division protein FtsX [Alphaproteobacteria bacterium]GIX14189.1 MAG: hypothetical protein KatS3mg118_2148 [Paracoccaceae bacterium]
MNRPPRPPAIVPPNPALAALVLLAAAAATLLAAFALAVGLAAGRLAWQWSDALSGAATLRLPAAAGDGDAALARALEILRQTPGIRSARPLEDAEGRALLRPWLGDALPPESLPLPRLVVIELEGDGPDAESLRLRLAGEIPGAVYDDHARWREPLRRAGLALIAVAGVAVALSLALAVAVVGLSVTASLAAHVGVLTTLRLIGADDAFVTRGFVRRFTALALIGAGLGTALGAGALALLPEPDPAAAPLVPALAPRGLEWAAFPPLPLLVAGAAWLAARLATRRALMRID